MQHTKKTAIETDRVSKSDTMFTTLKNKIKEETGNDVCASSHQPPYLSHRSSFSLSNNGDNNNAHIAALASLNSNGMITSASASNSNSLHQYSSLSPIEQLNTIIMQKNSEIAALNERLNESHDKYTQLSDDYEQLQAAHDRLEKGNGILDEALKVAQEQKEMICHEQDKIQNLQLQEISKLKSLLHFREQEAVDRLSTIKQKENQLELCQNENIRLREIEANFENVQDELEKLRHSSQLGKNNLTATLAAVEEQNRHLTSKLQIYEEARINFTVNQSKDEKVQALLRERRMLEQRLEEAHLHLSDIKSTWSAQNMALETQVDRLSRQVAAETTEKRKALKAQDEYAEKSKHIAFQLEKAHSEIEQRDQKIKLLSEEIDEISSTFRTFKDDNEEEVTFLRNKVNKTTNEIYELKESLKNFGERLIAQTDDSDKLTKTLNARIDALQQELNDVRNLLEKEKQEKNSALLKNAEISQSEDRLKQELRQESHEVSELYETAQSLQASLQAKSIEVDRLNGQRNELEQKLGQCRQQLDCVEDLRKEINDKNKAIKVLNQRLSDMKKTLQHELKSNNGNLNPVASNGVGNSNCAPANDTADKLISDMTKQTATIVMDDVNFKYLKHVILKFLTSREVEARHLIRAIGTLLNLSNDEEQLLHDTLNFKVSWFGTRPTDLSARNRHQKLFPIPSQSMS